MNREKQSLGTGSLLWSDRSMANEKMKKTGNGTDVVKQLR
jgi:hypothetical protein